MTTVIEPEFGYLNPEHLLVDPDTNIRKGAAADKDLIASVKEHGVIEPIVAWRTGDDQVRVRHGARRALAAIAAGRDLVPVLIFPDERSTDVQEAAAGQDAADRIMHQWAENEHREPLTEADRAGAVAQLFELGVSANVIARKLRLGRKDVAAAKAIAGNQAAGEAIGAYDLTMQQAAGIAEFGDDPDTVDALVAAAKRGGFDHTLERLRGKRDELAACAAKAAELRDQGVTVIAGGPDYANTTARFRDLDDDSHAECPGRVAYVHVPYWGGGQPQVTWACSDPDQYGHKRHDTAGPDEQQSAAEKSAERKRVIAGNKEWRAARIVRRRWLAEFLARETAPKDALGYVLAEFVIGDYAVRESMSSGHPLAAEALGLTDRQALREAFGKASAPRQMMIALGCVLGGHEEAIHDNIWRGGADSWRSADTIAGSVARYFRQIESWGYELADLEREVTYGKTTPAEELSCACGQPVHLSFDGGEEGSWKHDDPDLDTTHPACLATKLAGEEAVNDPEAAQ